LLPSSTESKVVDALLTTKQHGVVIFDLDSEDLEAGDAFEELDNRQADLEAALKSRLLENRQLRKRSDLI
jgi:hypothetical protein